MGVTPTTTNTIMKTFLLLCALAAFAVAHPSDDVATDLLTVTEAHANDVVPETSFAETTSKVGGHWTDCRLGDGNCAKPTIYTTSRVHHCKTKKDCEYKVDTKLQAGIVTRVHCSKWNKNNCDEWMGEFNNRAKRDGVVGHIPFCHDLDSVKHTLCKCKGKHQDWKGKGKACFEGPNPKTTKRCYSSAPLYHDHYTGKPVYSKKAGKCEHVEYKQGPWSHTEKMMGACNSNGYAWANTCAYPKGIKRKAPKKAKVCACRVEGYKTSEVIHLVEGHGKKHHGVHYKVFDWHKPGRGAQVKSFHRITCQGCGTVTLHDNDHRGKDNHNMQCCGKKVCKFEANGGVFSHGWDLRDDVSRIDLVHPC